MSGARALAGEEMGIVCQVAYCAHYELTNITYFLKSIMAGLQILPRSNGHTLPPEKRALQISAIWVSSNFRNLEIR